MKKHWWVDLSLILLIIVMGVFVVLELRQTISFARMEGDSPSTTPGELTFETELITPVTNTSAEASPPGDEPLGLINLDGDAAYISAYEGTPMLVNFWATWCPPCVKEMPLIQDYADRYIDELVVLAVNAGEDESVVREFIERYQLNLTILLDPASSATRHYRVFGFPTTLFFDASGELVSTHIGELSTGLLDRYLLEIGIGE